MITSIGSQSETINPHFLLCWLGRCCEMLFLGRRLQPLSTFGAISGCNPLEIQLLNFDCRVDCCFVSRTVLSTLSHLEWQEKCRQMAEKRSSPLLTAAEFPTELPCLNKMAGNVSTSESLSHLSELSSFVVFQEKKRNKQLVVIVVTEIPLVCSTELGTRPLDGVGRRLFFFDKRLWSGTLIKVDKFRRFTDRFTLDFVKFMFCLTVFSTWIVNCR